MIRGIYIGRPAVAGCITFSLFLSRALYKFQPWNPVLEFLNQPLVAFIAFNMAAVIVLYPFMKGIKAILLAIIMEIFLLFFIYAYYVV